MEEFLVPTRSTDDNLDDRGPNVQEDPIGCLEKCFQWLNCGDREGESTTESECPLSPLVETLSLESHTRLTVPTPCLEDWNDFSCVLGELEQTSPLPKMEDEFLCKLCPETFNTEMALKDHVDSFHYIKFIFTDKGKVKVMRVEVSTSEKFDPCVEGQLNAMNMNVDLNFISVEPAEGYNQNQSLLQVNPDELNRRKMECGLGIMIPNIVFPQMQAAIERADTPFVVFQPLNSENNYLLAILQMNSNRQILYPATRSDLNIACGLRKNRSYHSKPIRRRPAKDDQGEMECEIKSTESHNASGSTTTGMDDIVPSERETDTPMQVETPGSSNKLVLDKTSPIFSKISVVALVKQVLDNETGRCIVQLEAPNGILENIELCNPKEFVSFGIQCKVKRLRCNMEASAPESSNPAGSPESPSSKRRCCGEFNERQE